MNTILAGMPVATTAVAVMVKNIETASVDEIPIEADQCQCRTCGQVFHNIDGFDAHRNGSGATRRCNKDIPVVASLSEAIKATGMTVLRGIIGFAKDHQNLFKVLSQRALMKRRGRPTINMWGLIRFTLETFQGIASSPSVAPSRRRNTSSTQLVFIEEALF